MEMTKDKTMDAFLETIADIVDAIPAVEAAGGSLTLPYAIPSGASKCIERRVFAKIWWQSSLRNGKL